MRTCPDFGLRLIAAAWFMAGTCAAQEWATSAPGSQGVNETRLAELHSHALGALPHLRSLLIVRHGFLIYEKYYGGSSREEYQNVQSMTKSVTSALIGIAIRQGRLRVDQKVLDLFPEIDSPADSRTRDITVEHLLTMSSGIRMDPPGWDRDENPSALAQLLDAAPGTKYIYSSYAQHVLSAVLCRVTRDSVLNFANANLFRPLGISKVVWYRDRSGMELGCGSSLWRARDLLKLGQLYLNGGRWNGTEVIPAWYVAESAKMHIAGDFFGTRVSYGYLWFTDTVSGHEVYCARGFGGQYLLVAPALDLVLLCTSDWRQPEYPEHYLLMRAFVIPSIVGSR